MKTNLFILCLYLSTTQIQAIENHNNVIDKSIDFNEIGLPSLDLIYGEDDRTEIDLYEEAHIREASKSIAMRVSKRRLTVDRNDSNRVLFPNITLGKSNPQICESERFRDQISLGNCSGFLINENTLVTAGHCMNSIRDCSDFKWIFGFKDKTTELHSNQVYSCHKIITQRYVYNEKEISDYAIIKLDRPVVNRTPLEFRKFGWPRFNTPLVIIGHPMGLPMKATDGGVVSRMNDVEREHPLRSFLLRSHYFTANLDAYGGNSGSPVFNKKTGKVEGILVQGADDFVYNQQKECLESRKLSNSHLETYEKVMRITKVPGL